MKITFSILMIFTVMTISQCGKSDKSASDAKKSTEKTDTKIEVRYVTAKGGLRMRDKPDTSGNKMGIIPTRTKVDLLEETGKAMTISGATGKWTKVKWADKKGWVFGGFLSVKKANQPSDTKALFYQVEFSKSLSKYYTIFTKSKNSSTLTSEVGISGCISVEIQPSSYFFNTKGVYFKITVGTGDEIMDPTNSSVVDCKDRVTSIMKCFISKKELVSKENGELKCD